jgi:Right handed beta helix region
MTGLRRSAITAALVLLTATCMTVGPLASNAGAATLNVTNNHDSGAGSLRQALLTAAGSSGPDTINVAGGLGTITLASPLAWTASGTGDQSVTIEGNGVTIDLNGQPRGLVDDGGRGVTISSVTIKGAGGSVSNDAAPLMSEGGAISASKCTITGNHISNDDDSAGGILSEGGPVTVNSCTITNNTDTTNGGDLAGGIVSEGGSVDISNSTITGNTATGTVEAGDGAGGVLSEGGQVIITTSTVSGNTVNAPGNVGGGVNSEGGSVTFRTVTVDCNTATSGAGDGAGGVLSEGGNVTANGSSIVGNRATTSGTVDNQLLVVGGTKTLGTTTVSDDQSTCAQPATTTTTAPATTTTAAAQPVTVQPAFTG